MTSIRVFNHSHPVEFNIQVHGSFDVYPGCLGAVHADGRPVTEDQPARVGDVISIFLTGLTPQTEPAPTDRLVPLPIGLPDNLELLWAGLAPGLFGIQQVNARVLRVPDAGAVLLSGTPSCTMPPIR